LEAGSEYIGYSGTGVFTQSSGINVVYYNLRIANGIYNLSGTGYMEANQEDIYGIFNHSGGINISGGIYISDFFSVHGTGTYNLSGTGQLYAISERIIHGDEGSDGIFNQSGGTNYTNSLTFSSGGIYNFTGGTLILYAIENIDLDGLFKFGGGRLQAPGNVNITSPMTLTGIGGNANVDTAGHSVTLSGQLSGTGGLNKLGAGTLSLNALNAYSGATIVNGGTLEIAGGIDASGTSLIDVQSGTAVLKTVNVNKTNLNINTAALATFEVANGTHVVGMIDGSGTTQVDSGANLTAAYICQDTLSIGNGAIVTIQPITGGPMSGKITPVPEPSVFVLLTCAFILMSLKGTVPNANEARERAWN